MVLDYFKIIMTIIGGLFAYLFGGWATSLILLCCFVVFDYISGVIAAAINGELSSKRGLAGASKKVLIFIFVAIANLLDQLLGLAFIMQATIFYYLSSEFISITENAAALGVHVPEVIVDAMANLPKEQARSSPKDQDGGGPLG